MLAAAPSSNQLTECTVCSGAGWYVYADLPINHPQFGKAQICACKESSIVDGLQALSGLTPSERKFSLDDIDCDAGVGTTEMVNAVRTFIYAPMGILTIYGSSGNAKTVAMQAAVNMLVTRKVSAVYVTIFDVMGWIRDAFNVDRSVRNETAYQRIKRIEHVPVLAIDEFDKVNQTDWVTDQITDLIDHRHRYGLDGVVGTIIAMNDDIQKLPPWITSRLRDGRNKIVVNNDADMRPLMGR